MADIDADDAPAQRKGRGNAILTYERVEEINLKLTQAVAKLDYLLKDQGRQEALHTDHETRLRSLEATVTGFIAGATAARSVQTETKQDFKWVWTALFTAGNFALAVFAFLHK